MKEKIGIYPGSFDPITYGHLDILERGLELFDTVIVAIAYNMQKEGLFTVEERKELIRQSVETTATSSSTASRGCSWTM